MVSRLEAIALFSILSTLVPILFGQAPGARDPSALVKKIQDEIAGKLPVNRIDSGALRGEMLRGSISNPRNYPGTRNDLQVYVPKEYSPARPACLLLKLDGLSPYEA